MPPEPDSAAGEPTRTPLRIYVLSAFLVAALLTVGVLGMKALSGMRRRPARAAEVDLRTLVEVQPVARQDFRETLSGYGTARAFRESQISAEITGIVAWTSPNLEAGCRVEAGEELVRFDPEDFEREANQRATAHQKAVLALAADQAEQKNLVRRTEELRLELSASERQLERSAALITDGLATERERDLQQQETSRLRRTLIELEFRTTENDLAIRRAESEVESVRLALDEAQANLRRCTIYARFAGIIVHRTAQIGTRVSAGSTLFHLVDASRVEVPIELPAARYGQVEVGAPATLLLRSRGDVSWSGTVSRLSPTIDLDSRTFTVYVEVHNEGSSAPEIPPGVFVTARVGGLLYRDVLVVPRVAFVGESVLVAQPTGEQDDEALVEERVPAVQAWLASHAIVSGGLEEGDRVVVSNLEEVAPGSSVRFSVLRPEARE